MKNMDSEIHSESLNKEFGVINIKGATAKKSTRNDCSNTMKIDSSSNQEEFSVASKMA